MNRKLLLTTLLITLTGFRIFSQTPTLQAVYQNNSGIQNNEMLSVETDNNGNTYFCGKFTGSFSIGSLNLPAGNGGIFVGKIDASGNPVWLNQGGNPTQLNDAGFDLSLNQNGDVYVCGGIPANQTASFNGTSVAAGSIGFVVKYDNAGNFLWAQGYSLNIYAITVDNNNDPVINAGDQFVYKIDPANGNLINSPSGSLSGNLQNPGLHNIVVDANNNIICQAGNKIIKFDSGFNQLWSTPVTPSFVAETFKINLDSIGNVYGSFYGQIGTVTIGTIVKSNFPNGYIYKLDATTGTPLFVDSVLIGSFASKIKEVIVDGGNYYISGDGAFNTAAIVKISPSYSVLWTTVLTSSTPVADISLISDDCLAIAGKHTATTIIGPYTLTLPDQSMTANSFISLLCSGNVGIEENANQLSSLQIFPNPSQNKIYFTKPVNFTSIILTDIIGKEINLPVSDNSVDINVLNNGMYFIKLAGESEKNTIRFIKY